MIEVPDVRVRTLCVLHQLSVRARFMAYNEESHERIAAALDTAELIAIKMAHSVGHADAMRRQLETLVRDFPEFDYILATFDGTVAALANVSASTKQPRPSRSPSPRGE